MRIRELIVDAHVASEELSDLVRLERAARRALMQEGATVVAKASYRYQPHGATLCLVLKESHFIVSTWPEFGLVIVNIFLCNEKMDARRVWKRFSKDLHPEKVVLKEVTHRLKPLLKSRNGKKAA